MLHARRRTVLAAMSIGAGLSLVSCGRIGFDLLPAEGQRAVLGDAGPGAGGTSDASNGGAGTAGTSGTTGSGGATPASGGAGPATGGATTGAGGVTGQGGSSGSTGTGGAVASSGGASAGGAGPGPDASAGGTSSGGASSGGASSGGASSGGALGTGGAVEAGPPPLCAGVSGSVKVWSFDTTIESWQFWPNVGTAALNFTSTTGNPTNGALSLDVQSGNGTIGWLVFDAAAPNLSGQTGTAWVWVDAAANVGLKMYAQSTVSTFAWADGGFVTLTPQTWTCLTINFTSPVYKDATFDPTQVLRFGVEVAGTGPFKLVVDQLSY